MTKGSLLSLGGWLQRSVSGIPDYRNMLSVLKYMQENTVKGAGTG